MNAGIRNYRTADPRIKDFTHDMNEHNARYGRVVGEETVYVLELERHAPRGRSAGWFQLTVWKAVRQRDERDKYATPDVAGNRYAWDAVGRNEYNDDDAESNAQRAFRKLKGASADDVREWCDAHPYEGPRSPFHDE